MLDESARSLGPAPSVLTSGGGSRRGTRRAFMRRAVAASAGALTAPLLAHLEAIPALAQPKTGGLLNVAQEVDPISLDPHTRPNLSAYQAFEHIYEGLVTLDKDLNIMPLLAQSWSIPDAGTYVFRLRRGVRFHDGSELAADDVKYSLERSFDPTSSGFGSLVRDFVDRIDVVDRYTVRIRLKQPHAPFLAWLAYRRGSGIAKAGSAEKMNLNVQANGTGPFRLKEYLPDSHIVYERHRGYWQEELPYLNGMLFKVLVEEDARVAGLRSRALDYSLLSQVGADRLAGLGDINILRSTRAWMPIVRFNMARKPFDDVRVRQAINFALDRKAIIDKVASGAGVLTGFIPTGYGDWYIPPEKLPWRQDLEQARRLLAEAGYPNGFRTTIKASPQFAEFVAAAVVIAEQLKRINIDAQIAQVEWGHYVRDETRAGGFNYDLAITAATFRHDPDGYFRFHLHSTKSPVFNTGYRNPRVDELIDNAVIVTDRRERKKLYTELQEHLMRDIPVLHLYVGLKFESLQRHVKGYMPMFSDARESFKTTWFDK